jgi:hypothetical protein
MRSMNIYYPFILLISCYPNREQNVSISKVKEDTLKFVQYSDFEHAFKFDSNSRKLRADFDLISILLLDSTRKETIFKLDSELCMNFRDYSDAARFNKATVGFVTESLTLKEVLLSKASRDRIINCVYGEESDGRQRFKIANPVYIKGNTAVILISGPTTQDDYYITLFDGVVQINLLGGVIE